MITYASDIGLYLILAALNDKPGKGKLQKKALHYYTPSQLLTSGDIKSADAIPVRVVGSEEGVGGAPGRKEGVVWEEDVYDVSVYLHYCSSQHYDCQLHHLHNISIDFCYYTVNSLLTDTLNCKHLRYNGHCSRHQLNLLYFVYY